MIKAVFAGLLTVVLTAGCQLNETGDSTGNAYEGQTETSGEMMSFTERADHLASLATQFPEVNSAAAVVFGPYAVVGINIDGDLDQSKAGSVKYEVAEALEDDPYGAGAAVTADADILHRLREMRKEMADGRPVKALADETAAIFGRIMPVFPHEKPNIDDPQEQEKPGNGNAGELDEIRREQSQGRVPAN